MTGYLVGLYHDGAQSVVAHGVANIVTGAPMFCDTGLLFGSITKVLTTTLVLDSRIVIVTDAIGTVTSPLMSRVVPDRGFRVFLVCVVLLRRADLGA